MTVVCKYKPIKMKYVTSLLCLNSESHFILCVCYIYFCT